MAVKKPQTYNGNHVMNVVEPRKSEPRAPQDPVLTIETVTQRVSRAHRDSDSEGQ